MIDVDAIFRDRIPNEKKLLAHGFVRENGGMTKRVPICGGTMTLRIDLPDGSLPYWHVFETDTGEEYVLPRVAAASGNFVGAVRDACETELKTVAQTCFDGTFPRAPQTARMLSRVRDALSVLPSFPFDDSDAAVLRHGSDGKWFAIIMTVSRRKIGLDGTENIEVINLKDDPRTVDAHVTADGFHRAYHMNKTHWYTVRLDDTVDDETLFACIRRSYELTSPKGRRKNTVSEVK